MLPEAGADREARFLVFTGRTGRWKGIFAVHSWVVFKPENATTWSRYDVVGWGQPVRNNGWAPDGRWFGDVPRAVTKLEATLPSNAVGKDFRPYPYVGLTDSGTGIEASLWGLLGVKVGWVEGIEVNFLGLVAGLDLRHPAVKRPGFGRVGINDGTAVAAPAPAK